MTELRRLCQKIIEALELMYQEGKITKDELDKHTEIKRKFIASTKEDAA